MALKNFIKRFRDITRNDAGVNGDAQRIEQLTWMLFLKIYDDKEKEWEFLASSTRPYVSLIPDHCRWRNWADTANDKTLKGDDLISFVDTVLFPTLKNLEIPRNCPKSQSVVKEVFEDIHNYMKDGVNFRQVLCLINEMDFTDPEEVHTFGTIYETILRELQNAGKAGEFYTPRALTDFIASHVNLKLGDTIADFACGTGGFLNSARKYLQPQADNGTNEDRQKLNHAFYGCEKKPLPHLLCVANLLLNGIEEPNIDHGNSLTRKVNDYTEKDKFDVILMNPPYGGAEKADILQNFPAQLRSAETADLFMILIMARLKASGRAAVIVPDGFLFGTGNKNAIKERLLKRFNCHTIVRLPTSVFAPYTSIATNILFFDGVKDFDKKTWATNETWFYRVDMPKGYKAFSKTKPMLLEHLEELNHWWTHRKELIVDDFPKAKCFKPEELKALDFNFDQCGYPNIEEEVLPPHELIARYQNKRKDYERQIDDLLATILKTIDENKVTK